MSFEVNSSTNNNRLVYGIETTETAAISPQRETSFSTRSSLSMHPESPLRQDPNASAKPNCCLTFLYWVVYICTFSLCNLFSKNARQSEESSQVQQNEIISRTNMDQQGVIPANQVCREGAVSAHSQRHSSFEYSDLSDDLLTIFESSSYARPILGANNNLRLSIVRDVIDGFEAERATNILKSFLYKFDAIERLYRTEGLRDVQSSRTSRHLLHYFKNYRELVTEIDRLSPNQTRTLFEKINSLEEYIIHLVQNPVVSGHDSVGVFEVLFCGEKMFRINLRGQSLNETGCTLTEGVGIHPTIFSLPINLNTFNQVLLGWVLKCMNDILLGFDVDAIDNEGKIYLYVNINGVIENPRLPWNKIWTATGVYPASTTQWSIDAQGYCRPVGDTL